MNTFQKLNLTSLAATAVGIIVVAAKDTIQERREGDRIRKSIEANTAKELRAIAVAQGRIEERIQNGYYADLPAKRAIEQLRIDREFETMREMNRK